MKLPDFESPSGDSLSKSANFGLSKWIFYVKNHPNLSKKNSLKNIISGVDFLTYKIMPFFVSCIWNIGAKYENALEGSFLISAPSCT